MQLRRKEWAAWLVGQHIRDMPGEKPIKVRHVNVVTNQALEDEELLE